jgi:hypothetical protein
MSRTEFYRRQIQAAQSRRMSIWLEKYQQIVMTTPRSDEERIARAEALEAMERAAPWAGDC